MPASLQATGVPPLSEIGPGPRRRGFLLVVDDEDGPRQSLRVIFQDEYHVLMAADGPSAIEIAQKQRVDVAVLDIRMAGMSGIEVLERLKYVDPSIEVIMITAFETTDTMRQALRLRACDYINKPFDLGTMRAAVAGAMQRRTTPNSEISSRISPPNCTGRLISVMVNAVRVDRFKVSRAKVTSASRCAGTEHSASSLSLRSQCAMNALAMCRAQASLTWPALRGPTTV